MAGMKRSAPARRKMSTKRPRYATASRGLRLSTNTIRTCRMVTKGNFTVGAAFSGTQYLFNLSQLPAYTEFTNLFQKYRVKSVKLTFVPQYTGFDAGQQEANAVAATATQWFAQPRVYSFTDNSGSAVYALETDFQQEQNTKLVSNPYKTWSVTLRNPTVLTGANANGTNVLGEMVVSPWLATGTATIDHFGIYVGGISPSVSANGGSLNYSVVAKYELEFKDVR